ncbi:MAG: LON peptidase substrate-binding domain-containing protein [Pseudomonadota bacterium]
MGERDSTVTPLFPLGTVLMPGGPIMLRIFEPRYVDMIGRCMRESTGFVVTLIKNGGEVGPAAFHDMGTVATIADWHQYDDGLLGITAIGQHRVRLSEPRREDDGLNVAAVEALPEEPRMALPEEFAYLSRLLEQLIEQLGTQYAMIEVDYEDAGCVGARLAEILPLSNAKKQTCLELDHPVARLEIVSAAVREMTRQEEDS